MFVSCAGVKKYADILSFIKIIDGTITIIDGTIIYN